jgi:hypothetical protein
VAEGYLEGPGGRAFWRDVGDDPETFFRLANAFLERVEARIAA